MLGSYQREVDYLRLSLTRRCDLACRYCRTGREEAGPELAPAQLVGLARCAVELGISTIRVTGGEPLLRPGWLDFLRQLRPLVGRLCLSTNGTRLAQGAPALAALGLDSVNVSLDSLDRGRFQRWSGQDRLPQVLAGIEAAVACRLPVKLNCLLLPDLGGEELLGLLNYAAALAVPLRFIEEMPLTANKGSTGLRGGVVRQRLQELGYRLEPWAGPSLGRGPARYYRLSSRGLQVCLGFIEPLSHCFCAACNRVRLDCQGRLYGCLYHRQGADLGRLLRQGAGDEAIRQAMAQVIARKPQGHAFAQAPACLALADLGG